MNSEKVEYTWWLYLIGILGLLLGSQVGVWFAIGAKSLDEISIIYVFLLATAILFLFVKREMTYLMYTGMFAVHCVWFTFTILMVMPPVPYWMVLISVPFWLCLGYLIYKYFDFRKIFAEKKAYETLFEEPYKRKQEQNSDKIYRITDSFAEIIDWSKQMPVLLITDKEELSIGQGYALKEFEKKVVPIISPLHKRNRN